MHSTTPPMPGIRLADDLPRDEIRLKAVRFSYPGSHREILLGVDMVIPAGQSLAIVGENGAGKTTLVKLLTRLFDPTDEADPRRRDRSPADRCAIMATPRALRSSRDFVRYPWSAAENIALRPGADRLALEQAATRAGALDIITSLPEGWDTVLSRQIRWGRPLGRAKWQRIALAPSALCHRRGRAGILVLDEPTAHLDVRQEAAFYDQFLDLTAGRTAIIIFASLFHGASGGPDRDRSRTVVLPNSDPTTS